MIRPAEDGDLFDILGMCKAFWCATQDLVYDHEHTTKKLAQLHEDHMILVAESGGVVIGFMIIATTDNLCSPELTACELAWYVSPNSRSGNCGIKLLKAGEDYAKLTGCKKMSMVFMESSMPQTIKNIYDKMGYKLTETRHERAL
jgi:GNAT superfamily N-acetyltransferase